MPVVGHTAGVDASGPETGLLPWFSFLLEEGTSLSDSPHVKAVNICFALKLGLGKSASSQLHP